MSFGEIALLAFGTVFLAEMGDKTQLLLIAMAGKYKVRQILVGTWLATIVLNLLAVGIGAALSSYLDLRVVKSVAALAFFWFAWSGLRGGDEAEEEAGASGRFGAVAAIFASFFIGELGDKTQLTGIALAASYANGLFANAAAVFLGCTLGLILADALGLLVGLLLKNSIPTGFLHWVTFVIFALFGMLNTHDAAGRFFPAEPRLALYITAGVTALFAAVCLATILLSQSKEKE